VAYDRIDLYRRTSPDDDRRHLYIHIQGLRFDFPISQSAGEDIRLWVQGLVVALRNRHVIGWFSICSDYFQVVRRTQVPVGGVDYTIRKLVLVLE
jgi:hypothetical protein